MDRARPRIHGLPLAWLLLGLAGQAGAQAPAATQAPDPWQALREVRARLAASGPRSAQFEQIYIPVGFSTGEKETGRLALSLPDCLRWDYNPPYPKSFLVCGNLAHYWSEEDKAGKRQRIASKNEPGLDLLLLGIEELKSRYRASAAEAELGQIQIRLEPLREIPECRYAVLTLDARAGVLSGLEYQDREGNLTRFLISRYGPLAGTDLFSPPSKIVWEEVAP